MNIQRVSYALNILRVLIWERIYFSSHSCLLTRWLFILDQLHLDELFIKLSFLKLTLTHVRSTCLPLKQISLYLFPIAYYLIYDSSLSYINTKTGPFGSKNCFPLYLKRFSSCNGRHAEYTWSLLFWSVL